MKIVDYLGKPIHSSLQLSVLLVFTSRQQWIHFLPLFFFSCLLRVASDMFQSPLLNFLIRLNCLRPNVDKGCGTLVEWLLQAP